MQASRPPYKAGVVRGWKTEGKQPYYYGVYYTKCSRLFFIACSRLFFIYVMCVYSGASLVCVVSALHAMSSGQLLRSCRLNPRINKWR